MNGLNPAGPEPEMLPDPREIAAARCNCYRIFSAGGAAMPLYGFHCSDCDKDAELLVGFSEKPKCPSCGSKKMQRQVSRVAAPGKSASLVKSARAQAAREGHFSNYSRAERKS